MLDIGVKVAALMTEEIIARRLPKPVEADKIMLPGRCRADLDRLSERFGVPFVRGPDELKDIPGFFGRARKASDMTKYDIQIFAEIVDASAMTIEAILKRAEDYVAQRRQRDRSRLPSRHALPASRGGGRRAEGARATRSSVDSADPDELLRGGKAGADYLLSLNEETLHIADQGRIDAGADPQGAWRSGLALSRHGRARRKRPRLSRRPRARSHQFRLHGRRSSATRELRRERPKAEMLLGTGNLTELTDADTTGITAMLLGIASELHIRNVLVVQVSPHTRRTYEEHDIARRMMFASRADARAAEGLHRRAALRSMRAGRFPLTPEEIEDAAKEVRDKNFRIEIAEDGIHIFNRDGHHVAQDAFALFAKLGVDEDGPHAFYLGAELARAEIAWRLGKRYAQDEPLDWGVAADAPADDRTRLKEAGHTLIAKKKRQAS